MIKIKAVVNAVDSLYKAQSVMLKEEIDCLPVFENERLVGLLTLHDVINSNPNRIVIDAMRSNFALIAPDTTIIKAVNILEDNNAKALLVADGKGLLGIVTKNCLYIEYSKLIDTLTGLYRSQYVFQVCEEFIKDNRTLSIIFIDLNKFGEIDKIYGHVFGDLVLKELGDLLKGNTPDGVYLSRYGGDEFVLLSDFSIDKCKEIAAQILRTISMHNFCNGIKISASAGIVSRKNINMKAANIESVIANLINFASLASTKAKNEKKKILAINDDVANEVGKISLANKIRLVNP
ncbi:MAG TPA: diguanylate cyclase [Clostridiaceae bacterium]|nr:diguanylate cyclase [Clostridiaceae bacterium]